jgi:hypothetical protein
MATTLYPPNSWLHLMDLPPAMEALTTVRQLHCNVWLYDYLADFLASENPLDTTPPRFNGKSLAIVIAVPVSVVVLSGFLCCVCWFTRKNRKFPEGLTIPRNGRRAKRGYAEGRSRKKRAGIEKGTGEFELGTVSGYRDDPAQLYNDAPEHSRERRGD